MHLKPNPDRPELIVRDPVTRLPLPEDGKDVELNTYWRRRLRDGDVVEAPEASATAAAPSDAGKQPSDAAKPASRAKKE